MAIQWMVHWWVLVHLCLASQVKQQPHQYIIHWNLESCYV
jgi:hypothetical protein